MKASRLLLTTEQATFASHSGYTRLTDYLDGAEILRAPRHDPTSFLPLLGARVARRLAFTSWYLGSSAQLEWQAWQRLRTGFEGVVHFLWADLDLGFLDLALKNDQQLVGTFHQCDDTLPQTIRHARRVRDFAAIVLMSETQRAFFLSAGAKPENIHTVLHGVDCDYFRPANSAPQDEFVVLSVGGYRRNFTLLRDIAQSAAEAHGLRFEIAAPPAFAAMFEGLPNVRFLSGISDGELLAKYQTAGCLLHVAENTTANNALLEAMACGLPIVAERVGGVPEYVPESAGAFATPGDGRALLDAIFALQDSPARRSEMAAAARARSLELDWPKVARQMDALYDTLAP